MQQIRTRPHGDVILQRDIIFTVNRGEIFVIMDGSGYGQSTLHHLIGLKLSAKGKILTLYMS